MASNSALCMKIDVIMFGLDDKKFVEPFDIRSDTDGNETARVLGVCRDNGELCVYTDEDYVIPIKELTNRELMRVRKGFFPKIKTD